MRRGPASAACRLGTALALTGALAGAPAASWALDLPTIELPALKLPHVGVRVKVDDGAPPLDRAAAALPGTDPAAGCPSGPVGDPLGLAEAVARALCQSAKTRTAWALARQRAAELGVAEALSWPTAEAGALYARTRQSYEEPPISTSSTTKGLSLNLGYTAFDGGRRRGRQQQARALLEVANATQEQAVREELVEAARAYHLAQAAEAARLAALEAEQIARVTQERVQGRQAGGIAGRGELLQAQTALSRAVLTRVEAEGAAKAARGELANRIGLPAGRSVKVVPLWLKPTAAAVPGEVQPLIDDALQQHPRMVAARGEIEAARGRLTAAKGEDYPQLRFGGQLTTQQPPSGSLFVVERTRQLSAQLTVPLYEGGAGHYRRSGAQADLDRQAAALDEVRTELERGLWRTWHEARTQGRRLIAVDRLVRDARESATVLGSRFDAGAGGLFEWLNAQQEAAKARRDQIDATLAWHEARLRLASQVGSLGPWLLQIEP